MPTETEPQIELAGQAATGVSVGQVSNLPHQEPPSPGTGLPTQRLPWEAPAPPAEEEETEEAAPAPLDLSQTRSFLTELVPAGMGEVLVTDLSARPLAKLPSAALRASRAAADATTRETPSAVEGQPDRPKPNPDSAPPDRQRAWEQRQELRDLGLLRERPLVTYDARTEHYWAQVRKALDQAPQAIVDPYTHLALAFADVDPDGISEHCRNAREYGREADALVALGRCYMAIGRFKGARQVFKAATRAEPYNPAAWWNLGVAHLLSRANGEAAEALQHAVDQAPGDSRAEIALGVARYHLRDYAGAQEHLRRQAGNAGPRAGARSMLACSLRMQQNWDDARVELTFLRQSRAGDWPLVAEQCLDCVERGEQKREGPLRARRRSRQMLKALGAAAAGGIWIVYASAENLFKQRAPWAVIPLFLAALGVARGLRGLSGKELPGEFGNADQGLPCWQATTWMRPRRSEF